MRALVLSVLLLATVSCQNEDRFLESPRFFEKARHAKVYKLDTTTAENFAVDVDILWVIDNSGSMGPYQNAVIKNSQSFIQQFAASSRLRWKLGLISTSYYEQPYLGFDSVVDHQTADVVGKFNQAVGRLGVRGDAVERTFEPVAKVVRNYANWLRPNAYFIVISVTDELEQSRMSVEAYLNFVSGLLGGDLSRYIHYGVFSPDSNDWNNQKNDEIVTRTNGKLYQIDAPDYGVLLADLGKDLVKKITTVHPIIVLDQKPVLGTIQVVYKGVTLEPGRDWSYNPAYNYIQIQNIKLIDPKLLDVEVSFEVE